MKSALLDAAKNNEAQPGRFDKFGQRYTIDFQMTRGAKKATIRSGWIIEIGTDYPKSATCFVI